MRESLVQLSGEKEVRIYRRCLAGPELADLRLDVPVKRCVDLDHLEILRQIFHWMLFSFQLLGIDNSLPVLVGKSSDPDMERMCHSAIVPLVIHAGKCSINTRTNRDMAQLALNKRPSTPSRYR